MTRRLTKNQVALVGVFLMLILAVWGFLSCRWKSSDVSSRYSYLREGAIHSEDLASARAALPFDRISLERTACFGTCPVYSVVLHRSGLVEYTGTAHVERLGKWTGQIGVLEFGRLSHLIEHERVLKMDTSYASDWTDVSTVILRIWRTEGGRPLEIRDEGEVGPVGLWAVYSAIDLMATKIRWVREGNNR